MINFHTKPTKVEKTTTSQKLGEVFHLKVDDGMTEKNHPNFFRFVHSRTFCLAAAETMSYSGETRETTDLHWRPISCQQAFKTLSTSNFYGRRPARRCQAPDGSCVIEAISVDGKSRSSAAAILKKWFMCEHTWQTFRLRLQKDWSDVRGLYVVSEVRS